MATYLQGITDYIPQIQPFTPDFNFYSRSLQFSQSKHDSAKQQLSNLYGSLLNAPMTREDNLATRKKFFDTIDGDIKKLSGMDLSLGANVQQGQQLFGRLYENEGIVKDMVWTKHFQKQMQKGKSLKDCIDPEKCGGSWWEEGDRYMSYKRQEFATASAEDAMNIGMVDYVAQQDVMGMATKMAKEAGLSMEIDQLQGGYITTTKNGPLLSGPLSNLFAGSIAKNGKVLDYYRTKAYVDRKDFGYSNKDKYGSIEAAEQAYITENAAMLQSLYDEQQVTTANDAETSNKIKEEIATEVRTNGANPKSSVFDAYNQMGQEADAYQSSSELYSNASGETKLASNSMQGRALDRSMAAFYLGNDINKAASTLAYKDYKFKMKADQYSLESVKQRNRLVMEDYKQKNKLDFEKYKFDLKQYENQLAAQGSSAYNTPSQVDIAGSTDAGPSLWGEDHEQTYDKLEAGATQFKEDRQKLVNDLSAPEKMILENAYKATESSAVQGNTQAKADYVAMTKEYLAGKANTDSKTGLDVIAFSDSWDVDNDDGLMAKATKKAAAAVELSSSKDALRRLNAGGSLDEQFNLARQMGVDVRSLSGSDADQMYMNTFEKFSQTDPNGENVSRPYLRQVNQFASQMRGDIQAKRAYLGKMDEAYANLAGGVINKVKGGMGGYTKDMQDAMEAYIDPSTGHARDYVDFERAYKAKGYSAAQAKEIYRQDRQYTPFEERDADDLAAGKKPGATQNNTWDISDGIYNYLASGVDAVGTTVSGVTELVGDGLGFIFTAGQADIDWFDRGWDYDSPSDMANAGDPGFSYSKNIDGKGNPGLLDTWKRAFSSLADPPGDYGWMNVHGLGNKAVKGLNFDMVDPQYPASLSMLGTTGMLKDAFQSKGAKFSMGGFSPELPDASDLDDEAKRVAMLAYTDMTQNPKGAGRLTPNITYTNIAGGSDDWVGMNMKFSEAWVQKFKGSKDDPGATRNLTDRLVNEGVTMYVPKGEAGNIFTQNAERSSLDILMDYNNEITVDASPKYTRGVRITRGPNGYVQEGMYASGIQEDGSYIWENFQTALPSDVDLTSAMKELTNSMIIPIDQQMSLMEKQWNQVNGVKDI
jgi:hypothetical protein